MGSAAQAADNAPLAVAEMSLAVLGEDFGDRAVGGLGDFVVGVAERQPKGGGKPPSNAGLARSHQSDERDGAASKRVLAHRKVRAPPRWGVWTWAISLAALHDVVV